MSKPGERVGAILSANDKVLRLLGYGVYEGDHVHEDEAAGIATVLRSEQAKNPRIKLDNGDVVWGCECWWAPEARIKDQVAGYEENGWEIREVAIADARAESEAAE